MIAVAVAVLLASAVVPSPSAAQPAEPAPALRASRLPFRANDVVYDARRDVVYAAVPSRSRLHRNHVVAFDPSSGLVRRSVWAGSEPWTLALSDDGSALYVGFLSTSELVRIDPDRLEVVARTPLRLEVVDLPTTPGFAYDIEVQPGNADVTVVTLSGGEVLAVDDGAVRPSTVPWADGGKELATGPDPDTFYLHDNDSTGYDLITLSLRPDGLHVEASARGILSQFHERIEWHDGLLYSTSGEVVDPATGSLVGTYAVDGSIEPVGDRTYVLDWDGLHSFQRTEFTPLERVELDTYRGPAGSLVSTGAGLVGTAGYNLAKEVYLFTPSSAPAPALFTDTAGHAHLDGIRAMVAADVAHGYDDGSFRPDVRITRGQMAAFLARACRLDSRGGTGFTDTAGHPHEEAIRAVSAAKIAGGYGDGTYRPDDPVKRAQMASFLVRTMELPPATTITPFVDVSGPHAANIYSLAERRITLGTGDRRFSPERPVPRGQMATFLDRTLDHVEEFGSSHPPSACPPRVGHEVPEGR